MPSKKTILIDLGKLKNLYTGLGQVSWQYGQKIKSLQDDELDWRYLIPQNYEESFGQKPITEILSFKRRHFPSLCPKYDIWHAIHQDSPYSPGKNHSTKYILTIHDLNFIKEKSEPKAASRLKLLQKKVDRADIITFISEFTKKEALTNLNINNKPLHVIYNGVSDFPEAISEKPTFLPNGDYLLSVGTILKKKNFHVLLDFIKKTPLLNLVIAGHQDSPYAQDLKTRIEEEGLSKRVILPGTVDDKTRAYLYENCKAFCFPSLYEGFGLPVIEAMRYGKPVFMSKLTSLPEIGKDHAFYWDNFEPEHMASVFQQGLIKFNRDKETSAKALIDYSKEYTWEKNAKAYIELYKSL